MKPISEFPYGNDMKPSNPMHKKMLLLQLKSSVFTHFAFGYYDACDDLFYICQSSFMDTQDHTYECRPAGCEGVYCMMPPNFTQKVGPKAYNALYGNGRSAYKYAGYERRRYRRYAQNWELCHSISGASVWYPYL